MMTTCLSLILAMQLAFGLEDGTPVKLRLSRTISSADAQVDDRVDFDVLEEIKVGDAVVIPKGALALATVTEAQSKRRMGRAGKLNVNIDNVRLASGEKVALRAVKEVKGGGNQGKMTGAIVATSIVFFPAAPLFLFVHGKDITIPKGTEITAYINGNTPLDPAKFDARLASSPLITYPAPTQASPVASTVSTAIRGAGAESAILDVKSTPDGADITIDGKFVGSTPSNLKMVAGDHFIMIEKAGFKQWKRTMTISANGNQTLNAILELGAPEGAAPTVALAGGQKAI